MPSRKTLRPLPFDSRCLARSLVLVSVLSRRGIDSVLVIGVAVEPKFTAHAWVESGGMAAASAARRRAPPRRGVGVSASGRRGPKRPSLKKVGTAASRLDRVVQCTRMRVTGNRRKERSMEKEITTVGGAPRRGAGRRIRGASDRGLRDARRPDGCREGFHGVGLDSTSSWRRLVATTLSTSLRVQRAPPSGALVCSVHQCEAND